MIKVGFKKVHESARVPTKADTGSNGYDVYATECGILTPRTRRAFAIGLQIELPQDYVCWICPRSGMALKKGVTVLNTPGTVDYSYRGEVKVILVNHSEEDFKVDIGDRIAQIIFVKTEDAEFTEKAELSSTERGAKGFGDSGVK